MRPKRHIKRFRLGLILVVAILASCSERSLDVQDEIEELAGPDLESWDIEMKVLDGALPRYHIEAGYQAQYEQGDSTYALLLPGEGDDAQDVQITLFDEEGNRTGVLRAEEVIYYNEKGALEAKSNVSLEGRDGKLLRSEYLYWDEESRKVSTSGYVTIDSPSETLQGYDLVANEDLSKVEIKNLTGVVRLSK